MGKSKSEVVKVQEAVDLLQALYTVQELEGLQFDNVDFTANSDSSEIDEEKKKLEELNRLRAQAKNLGIAYTDEMTAEQLKLIIGRKNQQIAEERKLEAKRLEEAKKRAEEERKEREKTEASITQFISAIKIKLIQHFRNIGFHRFVDDQPE